jgi:fatty acid desaturase
LKNWLHMASGIGLMRLKLAPLIGFSFKPREHWSRFARWHARIDDAPALVRECRLILAIWLTFFVCALTVIPGGGWLIFAAWFTHVFQTLWIACEHTGLPLSGTILARTRSVATNPLVRWTVWNMNYHAEHHAWPSIPWHRLPHAHRLVTPSLESMVPGYSALHRNIIAARNTPSCDPN